MYRFIVLCLLGFLLIGCTNSGTKGKALTTNHKTNSIVSTSSNNKSQLQSNKQAPQDNAKLLTIQQLKKKVKGEVMKITKYKSYALVKSEIDKNPIYEFFNLKTGVSQNLPVGATNIKSYQILDKDHIRFLADGTNRISASHDMPYYFDCVRVTLDGPFARHNIKTYFPLNNALQFGGKSGEVVSDIRSTMNGILFLFTPQKGKEAGFYADYTTYPVTMTSYDQNTNTFIIEFKETQLANVVKKITVRPNAYIKSVKTKVSGQNVQIILELKSDAEVYTGIGGTLKNKQDLPYFGFIFAQKPLIEGVVSAIADLSKS